MPSKTKATPQTAIDEELIDNQELEKLLEDREQAKGAKNEAARKFTTVDDLTKAKLKELGVSDDEGETYRYRCGRFVLTASVTEGKSVSFETAPSQRITITPWGTE
jgi:hypothetical protein